MVCLAEYDSPRLGFQMGKLMINHMILVHVRDGVGNAAEFIWNLKFVPSTPKFVRFSSCGGSNASLIFREISLFFFMFFSFFNVQLAQELRFLNPYLRFCPFDRPGALLLCAGALKCLEFKP